MRSREQLGNTVTLPYGPDVKRYYSKAWPLIICLLLGVWGCNRGPQIVPVRGKVLYNGEPLQFGGVMFQPAAGQPARGTIQSDGSFVLSSFGDGDGATVGVNRVRVTCYEGQKPDESKGGGEKPLGKLLIPQRYTHIDSSGISVEVLAGDNPDVLIELSDDPPPP